MNYVIVYDPPGGAYWDLKPSVKNDLLHMPGVVAVRESRTYSLQPALFEDVPRPLCVICWGVEDRYGYEGRGIDRLEYANNLADIEQIVHGHVRFMANRDGMDVVEWTRPELLPDGVVLRTKRTSDHLPIARYYTLELHAATDAPRETGVE